ncbi:unnamed protein product [Calicophoron daubneyi]|uniref:ADP-ribosylhydrolase ARH3 n=1 Tax=Calicophoron daubneyi TaxID=300641 RepID=A0AAV2TA91_CALDB
MVLCHTRIFMTAKYFTFVVDVTRLTHTHPLGICGALLQAFAVRHLWYNLSKMSAPIDADSFLDGLIERLRKVQYNYVDFGKPAWKGACDSYTEKFCQIKSLLARTDSVPISEVAGLLGNNLEAVNSVPTAIYAFLRSLEPIAGIPFESVLLRCLAYTISLGGDTDTIGTMACSLAGGYCGFKERTKMNDPSYSVPPLLLARCEGAEMISEYAEWTLPLRSPNACGSVTTDADKTDSSQPLKDTVVQSGCKRTTQQEEESSVSDCKKTKREPANNDQ